MPKRKNNQLTEKQEAFCQNIVFLGMSYYRAYVEAGYSNASTKAIATKNAFELAHNPKIQARIAELSEMALRKKEHVFLKLIQYYEELLENPDARESDKLKASELLAKMFQLLTDNIAVGAKEDTSITFNITTPNNNKNGDE